MEELKKSFKTKEFASCYLFYGEEDYMKTVYMQKLKQTIIAPSAELMNYDFMEGKAVETEKIISSLETLPFLSDKRLVVVKDSGFFGERKSQAEELCQYLEDIPKTACIVFVEKEVDKRGKLYKTIGKYGHVAEFKTPKENDLAKWVKKEFSAADREIDTGAAVYLVRAVGDSMDRIAVEIQKLRDYTEGKDRVTQEDIDAVTAKTLETKIFDMVGAMGNKNPSGAIEIYRNLLLLKEPPIRILAMITRQFRLIYQCKYLLEEGFAQSEIAQRIGQRDFVVRECIKQGRNFSIPALEHAMKDCLNADIAIKTGRMDGEMAVELLLVQYSAKRSAES